MSYWDEGPKGHAVFDLIANAEAAHEAAALHAASDPVASRMLVRLRAVLAGVEVSLAAADPLLVPEPNIRALLVYSCVVS